MPKHRTFSVALIVCLVSLLGCAGASHAGDSSVTAIDIALEPDATMMRHAEAANARLRALALDPALSGRLLIADWAAALRGHRRAWLAKDGIHATRAGYVARARLYAAALESCSA